MSRYSIFDVLVGGGADVLDGGFDDFRYKGASPVTATTSFNGGVLTAFSNIGANANLYRVKWSVDGNNLD